MKEDNSPSLTNTTLGTKNLIKIPKALQSGFIAVDINEKNIIDFNLRFAEILGYTPKEMDRFVGINFNELIAQDYREEVTSCMQEVYRDETRLVCGVMENKDGEEVSVLIGAVRGRDRYYLNIIPAQEYYGSMDAMNAMDDIVNTFLPRSIKVQKRLEQQYEQMMSFKYLENDRKVISFVLFSIDTGLIERSAKNYGYLFGKNLPSEYMTFINAISKCVTEEYREEFLSEFHIDNIRKLCSQGIIRHIFEYERTTGENRTGHFRGSQNYVTNPNTGERMCIFTSSEITEDKALELIVRKIVESESDFVTIIDAEKNTVKVSINSRSGYLVPRTEENYDIALERAMREMIVEGEVEDSIESMKLANLIREIDRLGIYTCAFSIWNKETQKSERKIWKFSYFDDTKKEIIYSRSDITQVYEKQKKQSEALEEALLAAQKANAAKTSFLSNMSHEIRTPMNAIIGMTNIATKAIGNDEQIKECISKIDISAKFLLSLINDILDMSRIESGKMILKDEPIEMIEFLNSITYICYTQASAKNIDFECIVDSRIDISYMGDSMKLQQVLINVLSNAVKFTAENGKVSILVEIAEKREKDAWLRFIIRDTGVGIDNKFLDTMFEPFTQENINITAIYGGTGLGLAISKSILDLMGGQISVTSEKGVGTEFTIEVLLGINEEYKRSLIDIAINMTALIVNSSKADSDNTEIILNEIGLKAERAESRSEAVAKVQGMRDKNMYYDVILLDWKSVGHEGADTIRDIRRFAGKEDTVILVAAFDWVPIEHEAKTAGANIMISKPLYKTTITSAFYKVLGGEDYSETEASEGVSFEGKRLLLAEDQPLNVEIASYLLKSAGFELEIAVNGLLATELFGKMEKGYFDAILMDIRMPVMDGLEAAKRIRNMEHPDSKTIPIIAMTANAFDEDIKVSREVGMNDHLAKPIEPEKLYATLNKYIFFENHENSYFH